MKSFLQCLAILGLAFGLLLTGCREPEPVYLGFIGGLSGRAAGLGTAGRNGFQLAIEQANERGGIHGRQIVAVIRDTQMDQEKALQVTRELANLPVQAIIGPMLSQSAMAIVPEINRAQILTISPMVSTNQLSGRDDYFFRVYYTNAQAAQLLAERLVTSLGLKRIAVIYDLGNRAYTEDWVRTFGDHLQLHGGELVTSVPFEVRTNTLFLDLVDKATEESPQALLILANAVDTALVCQQAVKKGLTLPMFATGWSYSDDLFQFGGKAVEGLTLIQSADIESSTDAMRQFTAAYRKRFNEQPRFQAMHAYDATRIAIEALQHTTDKNELRRFLVRETFKGVQSEIAFDAYGEMRAPKIFLSRIKDGHYQLLE